MELVSARVKVMWCEVAVLVPWILSTHTIILDLSNIGLVSPITIFSFSVFGSVKTKPGVSMNVTLAHDSHSYLH
jgi:hypothetical protein